MRLHALTKGAIQALQAARSKEEALAWGTDEKPCGDKSITVLHRRLQYVVGRYAGWDGSCWMVDRSTGELFVGTLAYISEMIVLSSAVHYEVGL